MHFAYITYERSLRYGRKTWGDRKGTLTLAVEQEVHALPHFPWACLEPEEEFPADVSISNNVPAGDCTRLLERTLRERGRLMMGGVGMLGGSVRVYVCKCEMKRGVYGADEISG